MGNCGKMCIWKAALLFSCCSFAALACSCPEGSQDVPREDALRSSFYSSADVYTAVLKEATCRCFPFNSSRINCLKRFNVSGMIFTDIPKRYECGRGGFTQYDEGQFQMCDLVALTLQLTHPNGDAPVTLGPLTDVTGEEQCGLMDTDGYDCELSTQPCFYNLTVVHVYKGDLQPGDVVGTSGPDVLTSCGMPLRLLSFGYQYLVGIGSGCDPIQEWTPLRFYDESEVDILVELEQECSDDPSTCNGSGPSLLVATTLPLVVLSLVSMLLVS